MIRSVFGLFVAGSMAWSATRYVCDSITDDVCNGQTFTYTTVQAAHDAASAGDVIIMKAGQSHATLLLREKGDLTFRSSKYHTNAFRDGYRVARDFSGVNSIFATITTVSATSPVRVGYPNVTGTRTSSDEITLTDATNVAVGDQIGTYGTVYSPFYCDAADSPAWAKCATGQPAATYITDKADGKGVFGFNGHSGLQNGDIFYAHAQVMPTYNGGTPLSPTVPLYLVEFSDGGADNRTCAPSGNIAGVCSGTPDLFRLSFTSGGTAIDFDPWPIYPAEIPTGFSLVHSIWPIRQDEPVYVVSKVGSVIKVSTTNGGAPLTLVGRGTTFVSSSNRPSGVGVYIVKPVRNITFEGIEITENATTDPPNLVHFYPTTVSSGFHRNFTFKHCWIHGDFDYTVDPTQGILANLTGLKVHDSIIEQITSTGGSDTQSISGVDGGGDWDIKNTWLQATGENIMTGGNVPISFPNIQQNIKVERSLFTKPRQWWQTIGGVIISGGMSFRLKRSGSANASCNLETNVWDRCLWHDVNEVRYDITDDKVFEFSALPTSGNWYLKGEVGGNLLLEMPTGTTVSTCPTGVTCSVVASPSPGSSLTYTLIIDGRIATSILTQANQWRWNVKNHFESKSMAFITLRGNVFSVAPAIDQNASIVLNSTPVGSETSAVDYLARVGDGLIENNLFRFVDGAFTFSGRSYGGYSPPRDETSGFGDSSKWVIKNNLFTAIGGEDLGKTVLREGVLAPGNQSEHIDISHNTIIDTTMFTNFSGTVTTQCRYFVIRDNVVIPWDRSVAGRSGWTTTTPETAGAASSSWRNVSFSHNLVDANSRLQNNILMNRNDVATSTKVSTNAGTDTDNSLYSLDGTWHYPFSTYLMDTTAWSATRRDDQAGLFVNWVAEDYAASNYRLNATFPNNAGTPTAIDTLFPSTDGKRLGADIDEIEHFTGPNGADVFAGIPAFFERSHRLIVPSTTTAALSYIPNGSSCTVRVWPNANYTGAATIDTTDAGATLSEGRKSLSLTGLTTATNYWGKRTCGTAVDVFSFLTR